MFLIQLVKGLPVTFGETPGLVGVKEPRISPELR